MHLIRKALGSILVPKTISPEVLRGFLQLLQVKAVFPTSFPIRDSLIIMLFYFIQDVSIQSVPGRIC